MSFNLADLSTSKIDDVTFDVELEHPVVGPTGFVIQVIGAHSEKVRSIRDKQVNALLAANFAGKRGAKSDTPTIERGRKDNAVILAAATVGWFERAPATVGAKPKILQGLPFGDTRLEFSEDAAQQLYADPAYDWIYEQVNEAHSALANFMKA